MPQKNKVFESYRKRLIEEKSEELAKNTQLIENFIGLCLEKGLKLDQSNFDFIRTIGIVAHYPNLVSLLDPRINNDKEGLISFNFLESEFECKPIAPGYIYCGQYMLMAHPFFRRGHHQESNFSPRFVDMFWQYPGKDNDRYIALDMDRVRVNIDSSMYMELDTWFGAKFNDSPAQIEDGIVKLRPPLDLEPLDIEFFFGDNYSLDIKWYSKENIKVFQAEEFKTEKIKIEINGIFYYPVKYIHSEFNITDGSFRHFDGAIHLYTQNEYFQRRDSDFNYNDKNDLKVKTISRKLFKINGIVTKNDWIKLASQFFTGNPLVVEYFEGKLPDQIIQLVQKVRNSRA